MTILLTMAGWRSYHKLIFLLLSLGSVQVAQSQQDSLVVMFYNLENLFDTKDDPHVNDNEFLPDGGKHWNSFRLRRKMNNLAKVVVAAGGYHMPDILGVCEVENDTVLRYWAKSPILQAHDYQILHFDSPDQRGIDVACLYRKDRLAVLDTVPIHVQLPGRSRTRDILYCKFLVKGKDTLHYFVNHWPSRMGGKKKSEPKRVIAANTLRKWTDSLQAMDPMANILVMGDLNDHPSDSAVSNVLGAGLDTSLESKLVNLMWHWEHSQMGTHKFRGKWGVLDHAIVSSGLMSEAGLHVSTQGARIFSPDFVLEPDDHGEKPRRTYVGPKYAGGYSDHLPILLNVIIQ